MNNRRKLYSSEKKVSTLIVKAEEYYDQERLEQASYLYQEVLDLQPENIHALNGLGRIAMQAGMLSIAVELFDAACTVNPDNIAVNKNLALVYTRLSRYEEAIMQYMFILNIDENNSDAYGELARLNLQAGNSDLALHHYKYAFKLDPEDPRNFNGMVQLDAASISNEDINIIERLLEKTDLPLDKRCGFYFSLGHVYDAKARYDEAFANFSVANISKYAVFDSGKHTAYISDLIETFTPELFNKFPVSELNLSSQPVFVVGMPCSGASLVDQMLASLTDSFSAGNVDLIGEIADKLNVSIVKDENRPAFYEECTVDSLNNYSRYYINHVNNLAGKKDISNPLLITNTLPDNFLHVGLIALLFPNAHIIHCRRNPLDVILSCYFQNFDNDHSYAYDLNNIRLYYQQYERLMAHWNEVISNKIYTIDYEEIVNSPKTAGAKIINDLGIEINKNRVVPFSFNRYQASVHHWFYYEKYLHLLKKRLTIFGYDAGESCKIAIRSTPVTNNEDNSPKYLN